MKLFNRKTSLNVDEGDSPEKSAKKLGDLVELNIITLNKESAKRSLQSMKEVWIKHPTYYCMLEQIERCEKVYRERWGEEP